MCRKNEQIPNYGQEVQMLQDCIKIRRENIEVKGFLYVKSNEEIKSRVDQAKMEF